MSICPACNGTGPQGAVLGVVCPRCGGSGVVSDAAAQAETKGGETMTIVFGSPVTVDIIKADKELQQDERAREKRHNLFADGPLYRLTPWERDYFRNLAIPLLDDGTLHDDDSDEIDEAWAMDDRELLDFVRSYAIHGSDAYIDAVVVMENRF